MIHNTQSTIIYNYIIWYTADDNIMYYVAHLYSNIITTIFGVGILCICGCGCYYATGGDYFWCVWRWWHWCDCSASHPRGGERVQEADRVPAKRVILHAAHGWANATGSRQKAHRISKFTGETATRSWPFWLSDTTHIYNMLWCVLFVALRSPCASRATRAMICCSVITN